MGAQRDDTATRTETPPVGGDGAMDDRTSWVSDTTIRETPGVCGGYPRVCHTRVSVRKIVVAYKKSGGDFEQTALVFGMLTREQIRAALDYYEQHPARVDEDIERNARAWAELTGQRGPANSCPESAPLW